MDFNQQLGQELKAFRKIKKLTQKEIAQKLNKTVACVSKYEQGEIALNIENFLDYCSVLGVSPYQILHFEDCTPKSNNSSTSIPFFTKNPLFLYWFDGIRNALHTGALEIDHEQGTARLYLYIESYDNYKQCKYFFCGNIEFFTPFSRIILHNINDAADLIMLTVYNQGDDTTYRVGQMYILTYYYQPMATKCVLSQKPILEKETLLKYTRISKDEVKHLRDTNFLLLFNSNN